MESKINKISSSVYGVVHSWRLGKSLGIDLLCVDSICSFDCVYCQLGKINRLTTKREIFVPTEKVLRDLNKFDWQSADVITFSGSGEPTLAKNLGEVIREIKKLTGKPIVVLTNSSLLYQKQVRAELLPADRIFCKLDAWDQQTFRRFDRPAESLDFASVVEGIKLLRQDFNGFLAIQTMLLRSLKKSEIEKFACIAREIKPDEIQLNLPLRPVPASFETENRGNISQTDKPSISLKTISPSKVLVIRKTLADLIGLPIRFPREVEI